MVVGHSIYESESVVIVYDLETYPNLFLCGCAELDGVKNHCFEISERRDDRASLFAWLDMLEQNQTTMVGFNNLGFDYPVIHWLRENQSASPAQICDYVDAAVIGQKFPPVWPSDRRIPQLDLFKIHHFDNVARMTSLKKLEFNMRSESVEDLPFAPGETIPTDRIDDVIAYCLHDVSETAKFAGKSEREIVFRRELTARYERDAMNDNDTKIGKSFFVQQLEAAGVQCYARGANGRQPVQTVRDKIALADVILPDVSFLSPDLERIRAHLADQVITETKGVFAGLSATVFSDFEFDFGTGGLHGSRTREVFRSTDRRVILDFDVTSYYPSLAIVNDLSPEHLGGVFVKTYSDLKAERLKHKKGTAENKMLKLALNGVYGDSNNKFSPFFDPQYTMAITINGQLLLAMLAERMMCVPTVRLIQANTDGITIDVDREFEDMVQDVADWWQNLTCLDLECVDYQAMFIRDVNNYVAQKPNGELKLVGAYEHERGWHQNHSFLCVPKAAVEAMTTGRPVEEIILQNKDHFDFMGLGKAPGGSYLEFAGERMQKHVRYFVSRGENSGALVKVSPPPEPYQEGWFKCRSGVKFAEYRKHDPKIWNGEVHTKNKSVYKERRISVEADRRVEICNKADDFNFADVDFSFYIERAKDLVIDG